MTYTLRADECQINKNIARIIKNNPKKIEQLNKVQDISIHCTSDDHIRIKCELYRNKIARYIITGTRSGMIITANIITGEIVRKPRSEKPWAEAETQTWVSDILKLVNDSLKY